MSNNKNDLTSSYLDEISNINVLSWEEQLSLWRDYKINKNLSARDKLITCNLRFVAKIASAYQNMGLSYSDLIAEGNIGLIKAIDKFDGNMGYKITTYSVWWIKQAILEALQKRNGLMGDALPDENLIKDNDIITENDDNVYLTINNLNEKNVFYYDDKIEEKNKEEIKDSINILLSTLNEREQQIIIDYYGLMGGKPKTLEEIGEDIGITKERVRQISEKAIKKLRFNALSNNVNFTIY